MAETIRNIEEQDFQHVSNLYNRRKNIDELKWLFKDFEKENKYNALVALNNENKIIGAIGFSSSIYKQNEIEKEGVIFMSWILASDYKGFAGITLLKKVSLLGDFAIAISGTKIGQSFYPMLKYNRVSNIDTYYKVLKISNLFKSINRSSLFKKLGMMGYLLPSYFKNTKKKLNSVTYKFIPYVGTNFVSEKECDDVFRKVVTKNYIDWLLSCPNLKTHAFCIKKQNEYLGICVLYVQKTTNSIKGRIVHIPFLGNNTSDWSAVIELCLNFFKNENCSIVTGLAHHTSNRIGFQNSGFLKIEKHHKPVFIKDSKNNLASINLNDWHLQYSEGDKGYRGI